MATRKTTKPTTKVVKPANNTLKIEDGFILVSDMIDLIGKSMDSIKNACQQVAAKDKSGESTAYCSTYMNGASKLAEILVYTLANAPRKHEEGGD